MAMRPVVGSVGIDGRARILERAKDCGAADHAIDADAMKKVAQPAE